MQSSHEFVPFASREIGGLYRRRSGSFVLSTALQSAAVALLFLAASSPTVNRTARHVVTLVLPADLSPLPLSARKPAHHGGGGGGDRSPLHASKGKLPKTALRQFVPPAAVLHNQVPKLAMDPSILVAPDVPLPPVNTAAYGDPLAKLGPPSNGLGSGGGIGSGNGGGVGTGTGGGVGPGEGGGFGGGVYRYGESGLTLPVAIFKPEPEYSDDARRAHLTGEVLVRIVVDETGRPRDCRVLRSLGLGLDEEALKAVQRWRFKPGTKNGKPVPVLADVYVGFHLL